MVFYKQTIEEVARNLKTDLKNGLGFNDFLKRHSKDNLNIILRKSPTRWVAILFSQIFSPVMFILLIAIILSLINKETNDAIFIGFVVCINVLIGFLQEFKAEQAAEKLKSFQVLKCMVRRDGKILEINSVDLVIGDIVLLAAGNKVPADLRLTKVLDLKIQEAILTGEAEAASKVIESIGETSSIGDKINMAFMGTLVVSGKAEGIVVAIGSDTEIGKIARFILVPKKSLTLLQEQLKSFSWFLAFMMIFLVGVVFLLGVFRHIPIHDLIGLSIALAVKAIPEGLLIAVTVILTIGMQRMLRKNVLIKKLVAAETLGSVSVICTDKTGTLTQGVMSVKSFITRDYNGILRLNLPKLAKELLTLSILNNDSFYNEESKKYLGNSTEIALMEAAIKIGVDVLDCQKKFPRVGEIPFSSLLKYMVTLNEVGEYRKLIIKGAPEIVLNMCNIQENERKYFYDAVSNGAKLGLRIVAFASKDGKNIDLNMKLENLDFIGLVCIEDPLRETTVGAIEKLKHAGIHTIVITGDKIETAKYIAQNAGLLVRENGIVLGPQLNDISDRDLSKIVEETDVFARVEPFHKVRIVKALRNNGKVVAMLGDGVNDAPAIRLADIGVALGSGSDLSLDVADVVLLDNNLLTLTDAVYEGRVIVDNIRKVIVYLLANSFGEIILISLSLFMGLPIPITGAQILWINLVSHGFPYIGLTVEPGENGVMEYKPRAKNEFILTKEMKNMIFFVSIFSDLVLFIFYVLLKKWGYFDFDTLKTIVFSSFVISSLFYVFSVRSLRTSIFKVNSLKNKLLVILISVALLMHFLVLYVPFLQKLLSTVNIGLFEWLIIIALASLKLVFSEVAKLFYWHKTA